MVFKIREIASTDKGVIVSLLEEHWGSVNIASKGNVYDASALPGLIAEANKSIVGLLTFRTDNNAIEIVTLNSLFEGKGVATALVRAIKKKALSAGIRRLWLITTNDNTPAMRFYQKRGFSLTAIHRNAVQKSRQLKPEIPETGLNGIPIKDEIELELLL